MDARALAPRILIIDDEPANVRLIERLLEKAGGFVTHSTTDPRRAAALLDEFAPHLVLLDLHMPHLDGFAVLQQLRALTPTGVYLPVLILTADATSTTKLRALEAGASDFLAKPLDHAEVLLRIRNHLHTRRLHADLAQQNERLEDTVQARTRELTDALASVREMQGQLVQQERLSAFGTMACGVAHDFNNALSIILGYSEILLTDGARLNAGERDHFLRSIVTAAKDSSSMIGRLREFYRPSDERDAREQVDFAQLAREAVSLTAPKWKYAGKQSGRAISVILDTSPVPPVMGNAAELRELLTNLLFNAVDAMPQGGAITLTVRADGARVLVQVADQGTGMTEEVQRRCLEPFFTTKGERGTGLGLSMVYGIAQRHQATLQLESAPGQGTTFRFSFPAAAPAVADGSPAPARPAQPLQILVVDDQPYICEILAEYLTRDCHHPVVVTEAQEALARLRVERFDLLITDRSMPQLPGEQLAAAAREIDPGLRIILLTGYGAEEALEAGQDAVDLVLEKPVSLEGLRAALAEVFAQRAAVLPPAEAAR